MPTKKQHYIPRMLLKRFTTFYIPMRKPLIYQYDKEKGFERLVDIYDICRKNNLYEIKDKSGIISNEEINLIENAFSRLEYRWNKIIDKVEQEEDITQDDRYILGVLLILQLMRMPEVMKVTSEWLYNTTADIGRPLTQNEADRYMKLASFVWGEITPKTNWILNILFEKFLSGKDITIYYSDSEFILNGDRPVLFLNRYMLNDIQNPQLFLPIAKNHCIGLVNEGQPLYTKLDENLTAFVNTQNFQNNGRFIYSNKSILNLTPKMIGVSNKTYKHPNCKIAKSIR